MRSGPPALRRDRRTAIFDIKIGRDQKVQPKTTASRCIGRGLHATSSQPPATPSSSRTPARWPVGSAAADRSHLGRRLVADRLQVSSGTGRAGLGGIPPANSVPRFRILGRGGRPSRAGPGSSRPILPRALEFTRRRSPREVRSCFCYDRRSPSATVATDSLARAGERDGPHPWYERDGWPGDGNTTHAEGLERSWVSIRPHPWSGPGHSALEDPAGVARRDPGRLGIGCLGLLGDSPQEPRRR